MVASPKLSPSWRLLALLLAQQCAHTDGFVASAVRASGLAPRVGSASPQPLLAPSRAAAEHVQMADEYSTKVKIMAETRAPLRQARIFFVYPATIAGASIASYVSVLRAIGGKGEGLSDIGNLAVNVGIVAGAVFLLTRDLAGRKQTLEEVAMELGERASTSGDGAGGVEAVESDLNALRDDDLPLPLEDASAPASGKKKKKKKKKRKPVE